MWKYANKEKCNEFLLSLNLIDCKDAREYLKQIYTISNQVEKNYKIYKRRMKNGKRRTLYEPNSPLKKIQKRILSNILEERSISPYAKAYHKGIGLKENALPHVNQKIILKLDIQNFFENIKFKQVYKSCFSIEYFPKSIGVLLATLCTYEDYLPQGTPTASYISNLVMKPFDEAIGSFCEKRAIQYTRYSDDMTFSGDFDPKEVIQKVKKELFLFGLNLNPNKIHVIQKNARQIVTGIVVNQKAQVSLRKRKQLRQEIYYIKKYGIMSHLKNQKKEISPIDYLNQLYGQILFVLQIDPKNQEFNCYRQELKQLKKKYEKAD